MSLKSQKFRNPTHYTLTNSRGGRIDAPGSKEKLRRRVNKYFSNKRIRIRREVQFYFPPILFPPLSPFYLSFFRTSFVPHIAAQFVSGAIFDTHWPRVAEKNIATVLGQNNVVSERNSGKNWRFSTTTNSKRFESTR